MEKMNEFILLVKEWRELALVILSVSLGFTIPETNIPREPAFMAPIAQCVCDEAKIPVISAWVFGAPKLADQAVPNKQLDVVVIGRARLENPHWPYQAENELVKDSPALILPPLYAHWLSRYESPTAD
jgi:2,4-dienoyl-CoA reductase-like NADH-dependent reductase (Old Yellow Enzyme family)